MKSPLITIVTVVLNDREGLQRTLKSLESQVGRQDWDHLIVDGDSSDGTIDVLADLPAWSRYVSEPDDGLYDAMNKGLRLAEGELIVFLNAGDVYAHADVLANASASYLAHRWDWAYGRALVVGPDGRPYRAPVGRSPYSQRRHAYSLSTVNHQATFMRRDLVMELGGFTERFGTAADYHLLLRAGLRSSPTVWSTVDVLFATGGISDTAVYHHLWRRHLARADAMQLGVARTWFDGAYTVTQIAAVALRRFAKAALKYGGGRKVIEYRATRGISKQAE